MVKQNDTAPQSLVVSIEESGDLLAGRKTFSTGSVGYYASGKIMIDGQAYQCSVNLTLVGSKPEA